MSSDVHLLAGPLPLSPTHDDEPPGRPGAYTDTNDMGEPYLRPARVVNIASTKIDPKYLAPPWGYDATLFQLGENEDLLARLVDDPSMQFHY